MLNRKVDITYTYILGRLRARSKSKQTTKIKAKHTINKSSVEIEKIINSVIFFFFFGFG